MGQNPFQNYVSNPGGSLSVLNVTAVGNVVARKAKLRKIVVVAAGSTNPLDVYDTAAPAQDAAGTHVASIPAAQLTAGAVITLDWPCQSGITFGGTWPSGLIASVSYD